MLVLVYFVSAAELRSQGTQKPSRQSSLEAFSKGNYELAYSQFSELLEAYPGDPVYKYYSGVCLVKLRREPARAATYLKQARQSSASIRSIPGDSQFWLGRALQMSGNFADAITSYNLFTELNGKKAARDLGIPDFIQQCERKEGRLEESIIAKPSESELNKQVTVEEKSVSITTDVLPATVKTDTDSIIPDYDKLLSEALELQYKSDSVYKIAEEQKKGLEKGTYPERTKLKSEIAGTEEIAASFQDKADYKYAEAQALMNESTFTAGLVTDKSLKNTEITPGKQADSVKQEVNTGIKKEIVVRDTIKKLNISEAPVKKSLQDTIPFKETNSQNIPATIDLYSVFEAKDKAPGQKIELDPALPKGLIYRIQVAVFKNPVDYTYFKGLIPVYGFKIAGKDLTVYYAGMFRKLPDANKALAIVRKKGFKDAFVVSLYEGKAVSSERAAVLEKEWGTKPISSVAAQQIPADTIPPTLTFRVEVTRSQKPVKDDVLESINRLAGTRGLEIITLEDKTLVYLIGTFITYESAEEYADLLIRNGYDNAKVGAWLGKKEIPVETARELFERIQ